MSSTSEVFNASIMVTSLLTKTLENVAKDLSIRCINELASRHGFDASEEIRRLGLENLSLIRKEMAKKSGKKSKSEKKEKIPKEKKVVFPLPFISDLVNLKGCQGLAYNRGLFTQCAKKCMESGSYCNSCQAEADKNASGQPDCGTINERLSTDLYLFKDPKGRSPTPYPTFLDKLKLTIDQAQEAAGKLSISIPDEHLAVGEKPKKTKGRPKKTGVVEAENVTDLFAKLTALDDIEEVTEDGEDTPVKQKKAKLSDEEKAAKKKALEDERAAKKADREAKIAKEKAEREAKIAEEKAEREAKIAQEKELKEAKKVLEKAAKEAKRAQEKADKESKKVLEKAAKEAKQAQEKADNEAKRTQSNVVAVPTENDKPKVTVTRVNIDGTMYLKSSTNILYDLATKEEIGLWDEKTKTILPMPDEEEEEEYESGSETD